MWGKYARTHGGILRRYAGYAPGLWGQVTRSRAAAEETNCGAVTVHSNVLTTASHKWQKGGRLLN